ncbi:putative DNA-binding domain-containing protein [Methylomonas sp. EFPC1]|uniref:HvfC/BufC N-terminal domain-containing protein n=1 Tax=Methylomonas sp. EFPC1 TaxID=2812647 RepID=UPI001968197C|nr:putative DNA-binding domain-containing protein [Methylomonas sp. EFPC1]QSB02439.1 putative DNA-binding domain-containing protein [Methylomonas sp. EFPC1]
MHRLRELQRDFSRFVLQESQQLPAGVKSKGLSAEQRLAIYRNNTLLGLTAALRNSYPVVNRLVGEGFFAGLAAAYIKSYPPQSACLLTFGAHFSELISGFAAAQSLAYLADVAKLEWLWHEAYHAADAPILSATALAQIDPAAYGRLVFRLHPSARFIASDYPIALIWASNQADDAGREYIDLRIGACRLLLYRPGRQVEIDSLDQAEYQFLRLLAVGTTLNGTVETVLTDHPDANVPAMLQRCLLKGLLTDFYFADA